MSKELLYLHSCVRMRHACMCSQCSCVRIRSLCARIHVHQLIRTHVPACARIQDHTYTYTGHTCACLHSKTHFLSSLIIFHSFSRFSCPIMILMLLFISFCNFFIGRGSTSHIPSWYRALTDNAKALVRVASFKPIIHLIP